MKRMTMTELARKAPQAIAQAEEGIIEVARAATGAVADGGERKVDPVAYIMSAADMHDLVTRLRSARDFSENGFPFSALGQIEKALKLLEAK